MKAGQIFYLYISLIHTTIEKAQKLYHDKCFSTYKFNIAWYFRARETCELESILWLLSSFEQTNQPIRVQR